ncbi:MraY family glycosyltransferase [Pedobacter immunditicola]|uniref:MraY family glycosyltransferase n=1 Tax=Pedobacter immunditicola TaxID=3133440 RepID=UPI0030B340F2
MSIIIWFSEKYKLYDRNYTLINNGQNISRLGGIGVFFTFCFIFILSAWDTGEYPGYYFFLGLFLLFILGLCDDVYDIKAGTKFIVQLFIASLLVVYGQVKYHVLFFDSMAINVMIGDVFSVVLLVYVINAFNLIDGIDGLAAMLGALINLFLAMALALHHEVLYAAMAIVLFGTLSGFLIFNFSPAKVFMGDSGSMIIGFISSVVALKFIELNLDAYPSVYTGSVLVLALFIVPLYDTVRVFFIRLKLKKSPFTGDQNHIHHRLRRMGLQDYQIVLLLAFYTLMMVFFVYLLQPVGDLLLCFLLLIVCMSLNSLLDCRLKRRIRSRKLN